LYCLYLTAGLTVDYAVDQEAGQTPLHFKHTPLQLLGLLLLHVLVRVAGPQLEHLSILLVAHHQGYHYIQHKNAHVVNETLLERKNDTGHHKETSVKQSADVLQVDVFKLKLFALLK